MGHYDDCYEEEELRQDRERMKQDKDFNIFFDGFKKKHKKLIKNNPMIDFYILLWAIYKEGYSQGYIDGKNDLVEKIRSL